MSLSVTSMQSDLLKQPNTESELSFLAYNCLKRVCADKEIEGIKVEKDFPTPGRHIRVDLLIENGIKNLNWPQNTIVEFKTYLDSRTLKSAYNLYNHLSQSKFNVEKFIVIYSNSVFSFLPNDDIEDDKIIILSFEELCKMCVTEKVKSDVSTTPQSLGTKPSNRVLDSRIWIKNRDIRFDNLKKCIDDDRSTLFLGAGVSASANMPSWGKLLEQLLTQHSKITSPDYFSCDLHNVLHCCGDSYLIAARYINYIIDKETRAKIIQKTLYENPKTSDLITNLCKLVKVKDIIQIITTNYDQLVEQGLKKEG